MFRVEFGFGENSTEVNEWQTMDGLDIMNAESAEDAAREASCTDGLEGAIFRVFELTKNDFGTYEPSSECKYFCFD